MRLAVEERSVVLYISILLYLSLLLCIMQSDRVMRSSDCLSTRIDIKLGAVRAESLLPGPYMAPSLNIMLSGRSAVVWTHLESRVCGLPPGH